MSYKKLRVTSFVSEGYQINYCGIQFLQKKGAVPDSQDIVKNQKVSITFGTLKDFCAFFDLIREQATLYMNDQFETNVNRMRFYIFWTRPGPISGTQNDVSSIFFDDPDEIEKIWDELSNFGDFMKDK